jgi:hypothetical protein
MTEPVITIPTLAACGCVALSCRFRPHDGGGEYELVYRWVAEGEDEHDEH